MFEVKSERHTKNVQNQKPSFQPQAFTADSSYGKASSTVCEACIRLTWHRPTRWGRSLWYWLVISKRVQKSELKDGEGEDKRSGFDVRDDRGG